MNAKSAKIPHILVIEDSPLVAVAMEMALTTKGCKVTIAKSGKIALKKLEKNQYDLIFTDINLGDITGFDVAKIIRKKEIDFPKRTPIIGMSTEDHRMSCLAAGMDDFHQKPLLHEKIAEILKTFL